MVTQSGIYRVTVGPDNNPTYLSGGVYHVEVRGKQARFTSEKTGSSTYERLAMLNIFEKQSRVVCEPVPDAETVTEQRIVSYWYRGSMNVNPLAGNGRL
jgi:hypothetical protein